MAWKFNWWSCSAQKVANSEASRCLRHLKCRSTSSFSPPRQILNHVEKKLIAKEDQTTNLKVFLLQPFLLLSRPLLLFLLPPQYFVLLSLPRSACSTGRTKAPPEKRERGPEQVVQLLAEQSQVVGLVVQRAACHCHLDLCKWYGSSFWIHLNVRPHTKDKRCNKIHFWSGGTCNWCLSSEAPSTFVVDNIGNFWAVLCYTIRFTAKLQH